MISAVTNEDCMDLMASTPDKFYDLAIVDPPYGIRQDGHRENNRSKLAKTRKYHKALWDQPSPSSEYFLELKRVSRNQIIFGANHFISKMPFDSSSWIVWDKMNGATNFADAELAWTSFDTAVRIYRFLWNGMLQGSPADGTKMQGKKDMNEARIHPTQKPTPMYRWLLKNYAKAGDKILDTHLGSGSSRIAAHEMGFDFTGCELDKDYFDAQEKRFAKYLSQEVLDFG